MSFEVAAADLRPAIVCDDVENLKLWAGKLPANMEAENLICFTNVRQAQIAGIAPAGKLRTFLRVDGNESDGIELNGNAVDAESVVAGDHAGKARISP